MQSFRFFLGLAAFMVSMIYFGAAGCQKRATSGRLGAVAANVGSAVARHFFALVLLSTRPAPWQVEPKETSMALEVPTATNE